MSGWASTRDGERRTSWSHEVTHTVPPKGAPASRLAQTARRSSPCFFCRENCSGTDPAGGMRQHDEAGFPLINVERFPDMKRLVAYGHSKGVKMGWYLNGCACGEAKERLPNYRGDVQRLAEFGFDAVKIDGCGAATNMTYYAQLMAKTNKTYEIENCHWGVCGADRKFHNPDGAPPPHPPPPHTHTHTPRLARRAAASVSTAHPHASPAPRPRERRGSPKPQPCTLGASCPTEGWCPFNHFRTSGDINAGPMSWFANLQTTVRSPGLAPTPAPQTEPSLRRTLSWLSASESPPLARRSASSTRARPSRGPPAGPTPTCAHARAAPAARLLVISTESVRREAGGCVAWMRRATLARRLEVGRVQGASFAWQRAHFGAWCVVSAPLVLGLDLTDTANLASVVPIVTNPEAIAVNQQWAGHPGRLVAQFDPPAAPPAAPAPAVRRRAFSAGEASAGEGRPAGEAALPSAAKAKVQVWAKPQPKGTVAVYVVNPAASGNAARVSVGFEALGLAATSASVRCPRAGGARPGGGVRDTPRTCPIGARLVGEAGGGPHQGRDAHRRGRAPRLGLPAPHARRSVSQCVRARHPRPSASLGNGDSRVRSHVLGCEIYFVTDFEFLSRENSFSIH